MSTSLICAIACTIFPFIATSYYISHNAFTWENAELFCQSHCHSNLASIHNTSDLTEIEQLISNDTLIRNNLWIGLFHNSGGQLQWTDSTPFDNDNNMFALESVYGDQFELFPKTLLFNNINGNSIKQMFICNECQWNVLSKYVNIQTTSAQSANSAEIKCNELYGTSLASIHSIEDNNELQLISQLSDFPNGAYIGLNNIHNESIYEWSDNSTVNYMQPITNNNFNENCIYTNSLSSYDWTTTKCSTLTTSIGIICNAPNLICDEYKLIPDSLTQWTWDNCQLYNYNQPLGTFSIQVFLFPQNSIGKLSLEYTWKMDLSSDYDSNNVYSGIILTFAKINDSNSNINIYMGIQYFRSSVQLFIRNKATNALIKGADLTSEVDLNEYNTLRVEFNDKVVKISLVGNDNDVSTYIGDEMVYVRSIDIQNTKISAFSKSLYLNGYPTKVKPTTFVSDTTINPTIMTTNIPTYDPTTIPTLSTIQTSNKDTAFLIITDTATVSPISEAKATQSESSMSFEVFFVKYSTALVGSFFLILIISSFGYSKWKRNDFYRVACLIKASLHVLDMASDISFSLQTSMHPLFETNVTNYLFLICILSSFFVLFPVILSLCQLYRIIDVKWTTNSSSELRGYVNDNVAILYLLSIITGSSFTGVELCYSNMFNLKIFDIPLNKIEFDLFKTQRLYSTIAFENVPQMGLQIWYILIAEDSSGIVVYISMLLSFISIVLDVISTMTQKKIIDTIDYVAIQFDVIGSCVVSNIQKCRNIDPKCDLAGPLLGMNENMTDIVRPSRISNGLRIKIKCYISTTEAKAKGLDKLVKDENTSQRISKIFQNSWALESPPTIENIKYRSLLAKMSTMHNLMISENIDEQEQKYKTDATANV